MGPFASRPRGSPFDQLRVRARGSILPGRPGLRAGASLQLGMEVPALSLSHGAYRSGHDAGRCDLRCVCDGAAQKCAGVLGSREPRPSFPTLIFPCFHQTPQQARQAFTSRVSKNRAGERRRASRRKTKTMRRPAPLSPGVLGLDCVNGLGSIPAMFPRCAAAVTAAGSGTVLAFPEATLMEPGPFPAEGSYASSLRAGR